VPNSVLWLLGCNVNAQQNLQQQFMQNGIAIERLVFAKFVVDKAAHLERLQCADLCLDTRYYNSHTTGSDALWAGVPMVTLIGETFAARVGASLLNAVNLTELITDSYADYKNLAIALAQDPQRLAAYRHQLTTERLKLPLFDTEQTVKDLESLFKQMWQRYADQLAPDSIFA